MSKQIKTISLSNLLIRITEEYRNHESVFGINKANFFKNKVHISDSENLNAQGIVSRYLNGSKNIYFTSEQNVSEALKAWFVIAVLKKAFNGPDCSFVCKTTLKYDKNLFEEYREELDSVINDGELFEIKSIKVLPDVFKTGLIEVENEQPETMRSRIDSQLPLFNCFVAPCHEVCPYGEYVVEALYDCANAGKCRCESCDAICEKYCSKADYGKPVNIKNNMINACEQGKNSKVPDYDEMDDDEFFEKEDAMFDSFITKKGSCLGCSYVCTKCIDVCPNRANVLIDMRFSEASEDAFQILHLDSFCSGCKNCSSFCNHNGRPDEEKFTLFNDLIGFENSKNSGFYVEGSEIKVRLEGLVTDCRVDRDGQIVGNIPEIAKDFIEQIFISYGYLLGGVEDER